MRAEKVSGQLIDYEHSDYIPPAVQAGFWERMNMVAALVAEYDEERPVVDLGCNGGHLLALLHPRTCWGYDVARAPLAVGAAAGHDVRHADITTDDIELAPVVTICEVLEHLDHPHAVVRRLARDPVRVVVASGPYMETADDHYEQHHWVWDEEGFAAMFTEVGFTVVKRATTGIFQALVAVR